MKVVLLSCYELGHQPLGLASPAAHLLAAGHEVDCFDLAVQRPDRRKIRAADFVGISIPMHTAIRLGVKWAERVRALNGRCHLCFYGLYASLNEDYLLSIGADSVIGGEFELPLAELVDQLSRGDSPVPHQNWGPGGASDGGALVEGVTAPGARSLPFLGRAQFRVPARHLLPPLEKYAQLDLGSELRLAGAVEASRGCAHRCLHCPITPVYEGRLRIVQEQVVLADIAQLVELGARHITFADPDFLNGVKHSLRIVRQMHDRFPDLTIDVTTKIEHIRERHALIPELRELGCVFILSAVEALSETVLRNLAKGHTRADVEEAIRITREAGIALRPSLVAFTPWTTLEDYLEILDFVEEHGLIYHVAPIQYAIRLLVPPGSSLLESPAMTPYLEQFEPENFIWQWHHPDPRMDTLHLAVNQLVERASRDGQDPLVTYYQIRCLALAALAGRPTTLLPAVNPTLATAGPRPPRLTEDWFC